MGQKRQTIGGRGGELLVIERPREVVRPTIETSPEIRDKNVKIFLIDALDRVIILQRSDEEDSRRRKADIPGGKLDPGERLRTAMLRELENELPGVELLHAEHIYTHTPETPDNDNIIWRRHFLAGIARTPADPLPLSDEHTGSVRLPRTMLSVTNLPGPYHIAAEVGAPIFERLVGFCREGSLIEFEQRAGSMAMDAMGLEFDTVPPIPLAV